MLPQNSQSHFSTFMNLFEKFAPGRSYELCSALYSRFIVDDPGYTIDDGCFLKVYKYLSEKVIPHKQEVYQAGRELQKNPKFNNYIHSLLVRDFFVSNLFYHDLSKFSAIEAIGYANYNFQTKEGKEGFEIGWHHHRMNNPHHPEYWMNPNRSGELEPMQMPPVYIAEMIADWIGAGRTYGNTLEKWLPENIHKFQFGPSSLLVSNMLYSLTGIETTVGGDGFLTIG